MAIGYKFPYKGVATDIADIAAPGYANTLAPCVYFGKAGFITDNKTGLNDNKFLAVNNDDKWKTGIGAINYYSSSVEDYKLTNDIASKYSCPNFKKVIGFYGDDTQPNPTAIKVFERYGKDNKGNTIYQTYRLQVRKWNDGFLISIGDNATTSGVANVGEWYLKSKTGTLPTALIVGIQAAGGNGGEGEKAMSSATPGAGGGKGACAYFVLDWEKAKLKVWNQNSDFVLFDFYITPITNTDPTKDWKAIAYSDDGTNNTCSNSCIAINLKNNISSGSGEEIKSKCIVGCGQDALVNKAGKAGIVINYDLGDATFGIKTGTKYTDEELSEYGIHKLTMHKSGDVTNAGNGGNAYSNGYKSNRYWLIPTNKKISGDHFSSNDTVYQFEHLDNAHIGGIASGYGGGGGASNFADGGHGGNSDSTVGSDGTLGSGGGGGFIDYRGGKGGLPYIFFCSNIDFSIKVLEYPDIKLSSKLKSGYAAASDDTYIAYLQKNGDTSGEKIFIYPHTTSIPYPPGCDASNTLLYRSSGSGGWRSPVLMSNINLNTAYNTTAYNTYNDVRENPHWSYDITFTKK